MSYHSFKRVLGETNLERKCRFLFGLCLLVLITSSFMWFGSRTEKIVIQRMPETGRLHVNTSVMEKHWEVLETNKEFKSVVRSLIHSFNTEKYQWRAIRLTENDPLEENDFVDGKEPARKRAPQSPLEEELLDVWMEVWDSKKEGTEEEKAEAKRKAFDLEASLDSTFESYREAYQITEPIKKIFVEEPYYAFENLTLGEYVYYQPIFIKNDCVLCHKMHNSNGELKERELQAIIQVRIPTAKIRSDLTKNYAFLLSIAVITVFLSMVALYVIVRYVIVKPLRHLRDVSEEISLGNTALRADIKTGDEFEELGYAFNRMLQNMLDSAQELRDLNEDLDGKVDELAQTNMQLFEMNRLKGDFLATMSHELRTPLNSIIGFSDVLDSIDSLDDKQRRYVQNIQKSGRLLLEMINDILDLAKIESGKMDLNLSDLSIEPIIAAQCDMARPLAEKKNIDLTTHIDDDLPRLHQDQVKIQQVLNNLLSNAIKFTPEGGQINVTARHGQRNDLELVVSDTGVGIAEADQGTIFEKFRQGPTTLSSGDAMTREYSGTGLGLSIVKELCKLLGGEITLESELGMGSMFMVRLPFIREEQPKLDSPLTNELDELTRQPRLDLPRHRLPNSQEPT